MADDWQAGDYALCICAGDRKDGGWLLLGPRGLIEGRAYSVTEVYVHWTRMTGLRLAEITNQHDRTGGYCAARFIKITPPVADEFDREVIELLRREPVPSMKDRIV